MYVTNEMVKNIFKFIGETLVVIFVLCLIAKIAYDWGADIAKKYQHEELYDAYWYDSNGKLVGHEKVPPIDIDTNTYEELDIYKE